jgi:hypothetical protein
LNTWLLLAVVGVAGKEVVGAALVDLERVQLLP